MRHLLRRSDSAAGFRVPTASSDIVVIGQKFLPLRIIKYRDDETLGPPDNNNIKRGQFFIFHPYFLFFRVTLIFRMSTPASTTDLDTEFAVPAILEKIESHHVPGELTPFHNASPALSTDERLDDAKLENGSLQSSKGKAGGRPAITHRPTGFKVFPPQFFFSKLTL
jgi:hypothetical protein